MSSVRKILPSRLRFSTSVAVFSLLFLVGLLLGTLQSAGAATYTWRYNGDSNWWENTNVGVLNSYDCGYQSPAYWRYNIAGSLGTATRWAGWDSNLPSSGNVKTWWYIPTCIGDAPLAIYRVWYNNGTSYANVYIDQYNVENMLAGDDTYYYMYGGTTNDYAALNATLAEDVDANEYTIVWDDVEFEMQ